MKSARVLVVDDEAVIIEIIRTALSRRGHIAAGADSAEAAEQALSGEAFDLVLLDHILPGITGMQALRRLREKTKAPVYIMSGYSGDDTRKDVMLLGASGFLPKPLDLAEILALIDALPERA